jgi:hypothetical protein
LEQLEQEELDAKLLDVEPTPHAAPSSSARILQGLPGVPTTEPGALSFTVIDIQPLFSRHAHRDNRLLTMKMPNLLNFEHRWPCDARACSFD